MLLVLAPLLLAATLLRVYLLSTPLTELDADEAIVGLMANHILQGERPVFYYQQPYMGSLEAYLAAGSFALLGSSSLSLKLVPLVLSLGYVALLFATGYRLAGMPAAVISGAYAALSPAFLALWSLKARSGYIETLVIGQALLLLAMDAGKRHGVDPKRAVALGALAGLGLWTNFLIVTYLVPVALYLALVLRGRVLGRWTLGALAAMVVVLLPVIVYNLQQGLWTLGAFSSWWGAFSTIPKYTFHFFRHSLPVLAGLAQASSSQELFWSAFASSLASWPVALLLAGLYILPILIAGGRLRRALADREVASDGRMLLALVLVVVPALFIPTKFHEPVSEPRYLLPIYSAAVPLLGAAASVVRGGLLAPIVAGLLALNVYSVAALDPALERPSSAAQSTAANRQELSSYLLAHGLDKVYADYWLAYPLAFESGERIVPSVVSGGFNRYIPYAHAVSVAPKPAFVFIAGSREEAAFKAKLAATSGRASQASVSVYTVYRDVEPLNQFRP